MRGIMALEYVEINSKYTRPRDTLDRERLAARKAKRNHPKRHGENKERSFLDRQKHAKAVRNQKEWLAARQAFVAAVRFYWLGLGDHP